MITITLENGTSFKTSRIRKPDFWQEQVREFAGWTGKKVDVEKAAKLLAQDDEIYDLIQEKIYDIIEKESKNVLH